jgi:hypothetical protein
MDRTLVERIGRAVLYEGYMLYPYRCSSLKNEKRWTFGTLYPEAWVATQTGDRSQFEMECLLLGDEKTKLSVLLRFLHLSGSEPGPGKQDCIEREVPVEAAIGNIASATLRACFQFVPSAADRQRHETVSGEIAVTARALKPGIFKLGVTVRNTTTAKDGPDHQHVLLSSLASAHAAVSVADGRFVSLTDPPAELAALAQGCVNVGVWPVLIGEPGAQDTILASPIILPDYPQVAPESAGDLCDATEIEEILTLRILTLTDEEKAQVRASGERAKEILERAESLPAEHVMRLHGTIRSLAPSGTEPWSAWDSSAGSPADTVRVHGVDLRQGDRVRLRPAKRADLMDSALDGRIAVITGIEQDLEDNVHVAVVVEDDPGRDLGEMRQPGHRFFFSPDEIEPVASKAAS